mmetsp:Transcript_31687/g.67354  ORF Transcript_31687/g.67354 Transcript_31687/m.67354 type:complete len:485 (-) Transcript_31687:53-1507(-)
MEAHGPSLGGGAPPVKGPSLPPPVPRLRCEVVREVAAIQQEEGLSPEFLQHYCESEDLGSVAYLEIQLDSVAQSVERLGGYLPNLRQLRLMLDSSILHVRDLGTSLQHLEVLWMSRCGLQDLGGVASALPALREFYLPFNDVADLSPLAGLESLEVLDIEGNAVSDPEEVAMLKLCPKLRELTMVGNPVSGGGGGLPRQAVLDLLPQLEILDDVSTDPIAPPSSAALAAEELGGEAGSIFGAKEALNDLSTGSSTSLGVAGDEDSGDESSRDGETADAFGTFGASTLAPIRPLQPSHPLLIQGLSEAALQTSSPAAGEPDEVELITERVKRARPKMLPYGQALTDRPAGASGFGFELASRGRLSTASFEATEMRPATCASHFEVLRASQDAASDLTCGESLAGNAFTAARLRRIHASGAMTVRESGMDIRELLRRYQTYSQPSCISSEEMRSRKQEAVAKRPGTPDVRIHAIDGAVTARLADCK